MAVGQALVCGNTAHLNGIALPFPSLPFASLAPSSRVASQTEMEAARELHIAAVADSRAPLGLDVGPQLPVMQRGSQAHRCPASDR